MSVIRLVLAVWAGKLIAWGCRILGKKGSSLPGLVARRVYPRVLTNLAARLRNSRLIYMDGQGYRNTPGKIIAVTGTNGKTTVTHMLYDFLRVSSQDIVCNREGANMINGVTTAFLACSGAFGRMSGEFALLEIDEGSLPAVMDEITLDILVVTNFTSDQEDRYNTASAAEVVREVLAQDNDIWLVLNADDPSTAVLAGNTPRQFFCYGLGSGSPDVETRLCPRCSRKLVFGIDGHPGNYACTCGFARPEPDLKIIETTAQDSGEPCCHARLTTGHEYPLSLSVPGSYNYYNMAAAFLTGICLGLNPDRMVAALKNYRTSPGRMERFSRGDKAVLLNLVKNAKGYSETLLVLGRMKGSIALLLALSDTPADGRDVSWIWDVEFERLSFDANRYASFICTGTRGAEMAVRLKYAGVDQKNIQIIDDARGAVCAVMEKPQSNVVLLSSYSSLVPLRDILVTMTEAEESYAENMLSLS